MIFFDTSEGCFNLRAVAVVIRNDHVLIHRSAGDDFWALPGGRVELFETTLETVAREMREELELECQIIRLLWHTESFFEHNSKRFHELANYFLVSLIDEHAIEPETDFEGVEESVDLIFRWVPLSNIAGYNLYPKFLKKGLNNLPSSAEHVQTNEISALQYAPIG